MTEDAFTTAETEPVEEPAPSSVEPTGHPQVDAVLDSLAGLDGTPVEDHVAVFESAHDTLRSALANAGDVPPQG